MDMLSWWFDTIDLGRSIVLMKGTHRPFVKSVYQKINFLVSHPKHMKLVLQKNRLNETVLLST